MIQEEIIKKIDGIFSTKDIENIEEILSYEDLGLMIIDVLRSLKRLLPTHPLDMAEQQLFGFKQCENGNSLKELVVAMGLTDMEWVAIKKTYEISYLSIDDVNEIDRIFNLN